MKILITGAGGFFGSWLIPKLRGHEITQYDIKDGHDIFDAKCLLEKMQGQGAVVHLAAYPSYRTDIYPQLYTRLNIIGVAKVVEAMLKTGTKKLVYISSGSVYGFGPGRPMEGWVTPPITEEKLPSEAQWKLLDVYSASKLACEAWLKNIQDINTIILRINCIEPYHEGAKDRGDHWGWWCSQRLAARAIRAALIYDTDYMIVNVGEKNSNLDTTRLKELLRVLRRQRKDNEDVT